PGAPLRPVGHGGAMRLHRLLPVPVCLLALAAPAAAKPVKYQLSVQGTQVTTWDYVKRQAPTCDWPESESGRQAIEFGTGAGKTTITMSASRKGALTLAPGMVSLPAKATLQRHYRRMFAQQSPCPGGGPYGGGEGPPRNAVGTAKCNVTGKVDFRMGGTVQSVFDTVDPMRPPTALRAPAGFLIARADPHWGEALGSSERSLPARCSATGQNDADIAITDGEREWSGSVIESKSWLALKKVRKLRRGKTLKFSLKRRKSYPSSTHPTPGNPDTKGKTVLDVDVALKRISR
ncbi:MAG TPA: hypothetical protein VFY44_04335, partial [Thermoleophilaceae bacterium]|nr:hypothetical protein [Thermoleophilaceae bacterium]